MNPRSLLSPDPTQQARRTDHVIHFGDSVLRQPGPTGGGDPVDIDGERFYRIHDFDAMPPFFMSVLSGHDHWLFVSSTGGLTCGRRAPENALFPYATDDKIHDSATTTGPRTELLVTRDGRTSLWQPFDRGPRVYDIERNLYKNVSGNKLVFEEINRDLGVAFSYSWTTGNRYGFVRRAQLREAGKGEVEIQVLDGLRNLMPADVDRNIQAEFSTLVDGYKQAQAVAGISAALFSLSSIPSDRAEPCEALRSTVVWSIGLTDARVLVSEDQLATFRFGGEVKPERFSRGKRGAFFVHADVKLAVGEARTWYVVADVEQGPTEVAQLLHEVRNGTSAQEIERDVAAGTQRLERLAGWADGFQSSADHRVTGRHFANALFNIMRGGVFPHGYDFPREDLLDFVGAWNGPMRAKVETALKSIQGPLTRDAALECAEQSGDADFVRLVHEYLPLTFSRRHGDPSRPWNHFSIELENEDGSERLFYQGNWRDIFQNWEALAHSFPGYVESFITKFVNASTPDGHNPYRISRDGIDWEVPEPDMPWANIGYWGDHQIVYLLRLIQLSRSHHPGLLAQWFSREVFAYADVPYRIRSYRDILQDPRNTVDFDEGVAGAVADRVGAVGADGKLVALADGSIHHVNLLEKLLLTALNKLSNLVPGGGIWLNAQRPEWNDANNALVGFGLSMVTLAYLRPYVQTLFELLGETEAAEFAVSSEAASYFVEIDRVLRDHADIAAGTCDDAARKSFVDAMGAVNDGYRVKIYRGLTGDKSPLRRDDLREFAQRALGFLDASIASGRRDDGLFHSYNLVRFDADGYAVDPLSEMLEGQVAVLASGALSPDEALTLLKALRGSALYREDQNSYILYPDRNLPSGLDKNLIPASVVATDAWIQGEIASGRTDFVEQDVDGHVHFHSSFHNAKILRAALENAAVGADDIRRIGEVYESVFSHREFTGRSGGMYKYEGLGCIYWHMVSKLLLGVGETAARALDEGAPTAVSRELRERFLDIRDGLGMHDAPDRYGAFPIDPYSHTPGFAGAQQPGLTGQVKEDVITRFLQLGVRVSKGDVRFEPSLLGRDEFWSASASWRWSDGTQERTEQLPAGSLAFLFCGVPVVYRLADAARVLVTHNSNEETALEGNRLGPTLSASLFRREGRIARIVVDVPETDLG